MLERKWIDRSENDFKEDTLIEVKGETFEDYFDV